MDQIAFLLSGTGSYTFASGASLGILGNEVIGYFGTGAFNQTGGTSTAGYLYVGFDGTGSYTLGSGAFLSCLQETIGLNSSGAFNQTGGANTISTELDLGPNPGGTGSYTLGGGTLSASNVYVGGSSAGSGGQGALTVSGTGSLNVLGTLTVYNTAGTVLKLNGGTINTGSLNLSGNPGLLSWTAGTLHVTASNLEIGAGGLFGSSLSLPSSQTLIEDVGVTVDPGSSLNLLGGGLTISTGAALNNSGTFNETSGSLTVNGAFINSGAATFGGTQSWGPASVFVNLAGTATFNSAINPGGTGPIIDVTGGNVIYNGGGAALPSTLSGLSIAALGKFDLTNSHLFINYGSGPDPIASIAAMIASGYAGGAWNGPGIDSSAAAVNPGYGVGYADSADPGNPAGLPSGTIEIKYTLLGDADLNGTVNGIDFGILAANFNKGVSRWDQGDFNYDNIVNGVDFGYLAANFNKGASGASALSDPALVAFAQANGLMADVPEPIFAGVAGSVGVGLLARRRRKQSKLIS